MPHERGPDRPHAAVAPLTGPGCRTGAAAPAPGRRSQRSRAGRGPAPRSDDGRHDHSRGLAFLSAGSRTGKLGWVAADGRPLVAPVWFVVEDGALLFTTGRETAKGRAVARDPRMVICVDSEVPPYGFVQVQGVAETTEDAAEVARSATAIGGRCMGADRAAEFGSRNGVPGELPVRLVPTKVIVELDITG
ncbi:PPOX class F420-dependent oxidoreductase [Pseudonocardia saturnea]